MQLGGEILKLKIFSITLVIFLFLSSARLSSVYASETITPNDFTQGSWSKTIDLFDYARKNAETIKGPPPPAEWTSNLEINYINEKGVKLLYMGFAGVDFGKAEFQLPLQSFVERFTTVNGDEAMTASSFLMLMAFSDSTNSLYSGSPDKNDDLWASFTMGTDFSELYPAGKTPKLQSSVEITSMKSSSDKNEWTWGMKYKDLGALWWSVGVNGPNILPAAYCIYNELGFNYKLVILPAEGKARLFVTYTIGEIRDLWTLDHVGFLPVIKHYNDTGTYNFKERISTENVHAYLESNKISMSIVMTQRSWVADKVTENKLNGSVISEGVDTSTGTIQTSTLNGQKVLDVSFGEKKTYKLDTVEGQKTYDAVTRTANVTYYADNPLLKLQNSLLFYGNSLMAKMFNEKYSESAKTWMDATKADYLFITSYPTYSGYKVTHDPVYTAYIPQVKAFAIEGIPVLGAALAVGLTIALFMVIKRRNQIAKLP
jgi:hypothetical protein